MLGDIDTARLDIDRKYYVVSTGKLQSKIFMYKVRTDLKSPTASSTLSSLALQLALNSNNFKFEFEMIVIASVAASIHCSQFFLFLARSAFLVAISAFVTCFANSKAVASALFRDRYVFRDDSAAE